MTYDPNDAKSIFLQAAELPTSGERATFLEKTCAGKPELKARVESLLKTALDPDSLLDQPVAEFGATQLVPSGTSPVSLDFLEPCNVPERLGRLGGYEILEVIGRGGMGIVLRAMDVKLNRVVAIKVLAPELASQPQARKRFLREAQAAAAVSHDHVVTIHAVDDGASGGSKVPLLVMECIVGQSLQEKIDKVGALGLKEILRIGMQMASGLAAAHKQGLVHRDIKPANILLENGVERVKITDFGLARATDDVGITQSGLIAGTPQYMSPEQAMGQPVDQRSDLFSLGSVLYTMCTGRPAFRADSAVVVLRRVCDDTPRPIGEVNAEVPDWLVAIVNRLMAKKAEDRFQTAQEVATLLEQWLAHIQQPTETPQPASVSLRQSFNPQRRGVASRPRLVPFWAILNLLPAILLTFAYASDDLTALSPLQSRPLVWSIWSRVSDAIGFMTLVGVFASSVGLLMWKTWARKLIVAVCIVSLARLAIDMPFIAYVVIPEFFAEIRGIEMEADVSREMVAGLTSMAVLVGFLLAFVYVPWLIVQLIYFTRPSIIAAFEQFDVRVPQGNSFRAPSGNPRAESPGVLSQAWHDWWSERDRWITISVQTVLILVYLACMICFVSMGGSGGQDAEGHVTFGYRLGVPDPWFQFEVYPQPNMPFQTLFNLWSSSVLIGLVGCAAYFIFWQIEKARDPKTSKWNGPAFMLGIWGVGALFAVGFGHWQGYAALNKPRVAVTQRAPIVDANAAAIDLNGAWDGSRPWRAEFTHVQIKPGLMSVPINGKLTVTDGPEGTFRIDAKFDVASRTIEGQFHGDWGGGRMRLVVSDDGNSMGGTYGWLKTVSGEEPVTAHRWDMRRRRTNGNESGEPALPAIAPFDAAQAMKYQDEAANQFGIQTECTNSIGMPLRLIPPGKFLMGSTPEELANLNMKLQQAGLGAYEKFVASTSGPRHFVEISKPFYMGRHEVTVAQFRRFADETNHQPSAESIGNARFTWKQFIPEIDPEDHPVCGVSWDDATAFCRWLSNKTKQDYALPTEAQWEFACRAGSQTLWSFGDDETELSQHANTAPAHTPLPPPVGQKLANPFGLFDMHGNVDEWCLDWHHRDFYDRSPIVDPVYLSDPGDPVSGRVARDGSWNAVPWWSRSTTRAYDFPTSPTHPKGFRVVINGDLKVAHDLPAKP